MYSLKSDTLGSNNLFSPNLMTSPYPVHSSLNLNVGKELNKVDISIYSTTGQYISIYQISNTEEVSIPFNQLPKGIYHLSISYVYQSITMTITKI